MFRSVDLAWFHALPIVLLVIGPVSAGMYILRTLKPVQKITTQCLIEVRPDSVQDLVQNGRRLAPILCILFRHAIVFPILIQNLIHVRIARQWHKLVSLRNKLPVVYQTHLERVGDVDFDLWSLDELLLLAILVSTMDSLHECYLHALPCPALAWSRETPFAFSFRWNPALRLIHVLQTSVQHAPYSLLPVRP